MALTGGRGVDTAIEAVGIPATFLICEDIVAPGGIIANIGVHGVKADLHLEKLWSQHHDHHAPGRYRHDADAAENRAVAKIDPTQLITHHFTLDKSSMPTTPSAPPPKPTRSRCLSRPQAFCSLCLGGEIRRGQKPTAAFVNA